MIQIKNREKIVENGATPLIRKARLLTIQCIEKAVNAVEPKQLMKAKVRSENDLLQIDDYILNLKKFKHVYVVGGGKAGSAMAQAIEELLGKYLTSGVVIIPYNTKGKTQKIELWEASHPLPDQAGVEGTRHIIKIAKKAKEDDLLICLISGGGSSLMSQPREGITLKDKQALTNRLLRSGADIKEINTVRKHLSAFKGGWLAKKAYPATVLTLVLSDVIGDPLDSIASGPTVPDLTTFHDAQKILEKYRLWKKAPVSVRRVVLEGTKGLLKETPKPGDPVFQNVHNVIIGNNRTACQAAIDNLCAEGINTLLLPEMLEGEAREVGEALSNFADRFLRSYTLGSKPLGIVAGGETTVTVTGEGVGGRNQELALSAAMNMNNLEECVVASFSTDGVDGPTDSAGAIADSYTLKRAKQLGLDPNKYICANDTYHFFSKLGDLLHTKATGTNVNDICVIIAL